MKVTLKTHFVQLGVVTVTYFLVFLSGCPYPGLAATEVVNSSHSTGKFILFVDQGENANLKYPMNLKNKSVISEISWSKVISDNEVDNLSICQNETSNDPKFKCKVFLSRKKHGSSSEEVDDKDVDNFLITNLHIENVEDKDYGKYKCSITWENNSKEEVQIELRDTIKVTRKSPKGSTQKSSIIIEEGEILYLYCNVTPPLNDELKLSWFFLPLPDEDNTDDHEEPEDITEELFNSTSGIFQNFTLTYPDEPERPEFHGVVSQEHRGNYTCSVELTNKSDAVNYESAFPAKFTVHVRVRDSNRWMTPGIILAGEILALAIFTICIWNRVDNIEGGVDGDFADSDDEDEKSK